VEAHTFRVGAHTTADDPTKYRTRDEESAWAGVDPMARLEKYLRATGATGAAGADPEAFFADVAAEGERLAAQSREAVLAMTGDAIAPLEAVFDTVYAEPHPLVAEEKAWHRAWQAGFAETADEADGAEEGRRA
jgi:pyruvate dehydrogenase E1 component alpha subunit